MTYIVEITARKDRQARVEAEAKSAQTTHRFKFRSSMRELPLIRIPIGLAIYRMNNGRTEDEQNDWLLKNPSFKKDYFTSGEENVGPQRVQHELLLTMSKVPTRPIYQVLEKVMQQEEPLLITATGVVLNGNRRLAAMRALLDNEPSTFGSFQFIDAAVLPKEANELDLDEIEVSLQMAVETKLEYTWINQRLKMRRLMDEHHLTPAKIAQLMNYPKASRVNGELQELALVEEYLDAYLKQPRNYKLVAGGRQIFKEIAPRVTKKQGAQQELAKAIAFTIVRASGEVEDRVYKYRESFGTYTDQVATRLAADLKIPIKAKPPGKKASDDDPLTGMERSNAPQIEELIKRLSDPAQAEDLAARIVTIHDSIVRANKEDDKKSKALSELRDANTLLAGIDLTGLDPKHYDDADIAIETASDRVKVLSGQLEELQKEQSAPRRKLRK